MFTYVLLHELFKNESWPILNFTSLSDNKKKDFLCRRKSHHPFVISPRHHFSIIPARKIFAFRKIFTFTFPLGSFSGSLSVRVTVATCCWAPVDRSLGLGIFYFLFSAAVCFPSVCRGFSDQFSFRITFPRSAEGQRCWQNILLKPGDFEICYCYYTQALN